MVARACTDVVSRCPPLRAEVDVRIVRSCGHKIDLVSSRCNCTGLPGYSSRIPYGSIREYRCSRWRLETRGRWRPLFLRSNSWDGSEGTIIVALLQGRPLPTKLRRDKRFLPCVAQPGNETYANGIFEFNITRLLACAQQHSGRFPVIHAKLCELPDFGNGLHLNEVAILVADLSRPIVLAEISPGNFNVIDGNHLLAKARRQGATALPAYLVQCPAHVPFLTSLFAYEKYVEYWNGKVNDLLGDLRG